MTVDQVVGRILGQSAVQRLEALAAVPGTGHHQAGVDRNPAFILDARNEPGGIRIGGVDRDRETEHRGLYALDFGETAATIVGAEDAVVVLNPEPVRRGRAAHHPVRVLADGFVGLFRRQEGRPQSLACLLPVRAAVGAFPDAAAGDGEADPVAVLRVYADGVYAGRVVTAAEPEFPFGPLPQRLDERPAVAAVRRSEEPAGDGAGPQGAGLVGMAGGQFPDLGDGRAIVFPAEGEPGASSSCQLSEPAPARKSLTPKCPRLSAARRSPLRGSVRIIVTGSPRKAGGCRMRQSPGA
ncbi:hypothetical protein [Marinobacterium aestuariivivens]|uniref:CheW-like domain-containing protein n=1 Tax=Marinobacterium aestuariivivens TaxID=1698799 RepID=A0ABW2A0T2_9GAMM